MKQKGFVDSTMATYVVILAVVIALFILLGLLLCVVLPFCPLGPSQATYAVNYLDVVNTPSTVASIIANVQIGDKLFLEHVYHAFMTGKLEDSEKKLINDEIEKFLEKYDLNYYEIALDTGGGKTNFLQSSSSLERCGNDLQGVCIQEVGNPGYIDGILVGPCNVGRIKIDQGKNKCSGGITKARQACCRDATNQEEYNVYLDSLEPSQEKMSIVRCGPSSKGICTRSGITSCAAGFIKLPEYDDNCKITNQGKTPYCCSADPATLEDQNKISSARIPLFYKDKTGYLVVTTSD